MRQAGQDADTERESRSLSACSQTAHFLRSFHNLVMSFESNFVRGVTVFGSAILRVVPDTPSITVAVSRVEAKPEAAFAKTREAAASVGGLLKKSGVDDVGSSRVFLTQEYKWINNENKFVGYRARITFNIFGELDKVDGLLTGLIAAGANELASVGFQTTKLKQNSGPTQSGVPLQQGSIVSSKSPRLTKIVRPNRQPLILPLRIQRKIVERCVL
jgi:uncharacterized protein YggE